MCTVHAQTRRGPWILLELELEVAVSCGCWESNAGPLEEQPVFLTVGISLQPPVGIFLSSEVVDIAQ